MSIMSWDPFTTLSRLDRDFDDLVRRTWGGPRGAMTAGFVPPVEMVTEGTDVLVRLELPGIDIDKDVEIEVHDSRLRVSGHREESIAEESEDRKVLVREHRYGSFRREFALPPGITGDDVEAAYENGILEIRIKGVTQPEPQPQKVEINRGRDTQRRAVIEGTTE